MRVLYCVIGQRGEAPLRNKRIEFLHQLASSGYILFGPAHASRGIRQQLHIRSAVPASVLVQMLLHFIRAKIKTL